jgi:uncharacterized protein
METTDVDSRQRAVPRSNVDALKEVYARWGEGEYDFVPDIYADDFEWGWSPDFPGLAGVYRDSETPNRRLRAWLSPWERWICDVEDYVEHGDSVIVLTHYRGRGKGSGVDVDVLGAHVWRMRDGRAVRLEIFADRQAAFDSVGG